MLGGLEGYGSDQSDSESSSNPTRLQAVASPPKHSTFSLPSPAHTAKSPSMQPSKTRSRRPVFTVAKPSGDYSDGEDDGKERASKKPRLDSRTAAGSSSLLAILPAPSKAAPVSAASPQLLGAAAQGGGRTGVVMSSQVNEHTFHDKPNGFSARITEDIEAKSTSLLPPSLIKGKAKLPAPPKESISAPQVPSVDVFSLGTSPPCATSAASTYNANGPVGQSSSSFCITSAPILPSFEPPLPTPSDPYPGYYQLPSGRWAAYEPEFYWKHYDAWSATHALDGTSQKGFEGAEGNDTVEIDGKEQLDLARKEREEKKALTMNAGGGKAKPKMNIKPPKIGSRARTRHQLSALLTDAYDNREALEEKIAQGRRNRKEAGNKYGF